MAGISFLFMLGILLYWVEAYILLRKTGFFYSRQ